MNIHEYQAKGILRQFGVAVPNGHVCYNNSSAIDWAKRLGDGPWVVKAQIHAGGRGKGGGVKVAKSLKEVRLLARDMIGMTLITPQTGPEGKVVKRVLIEEGCDIDRELYFSFLVDRDTGLVTLMASAAGGMDIEAVAAETPEKIFFEPINPVTGLLPFQSRKVAFKLGMQGKEIGQAVKMFKAIYDAFIACDCSMLEINPLVVTNGGDLIALDAKLNFDDNALYRHPKIRDLRDYDEEDP